MFLVGSLLDLSNSIGARQFTGGGGGGVFLQQILHKMKPIYTRQC
jgi:hypothetical protein